MVIPTFKGNTYAGSYQGMPVDRTGVTTKHPAIRIENGKVSAVNKQSNFKAFDVSKAGCYPQAAGLKNVINH